MGFELLVNAPEVALAVVNQLDDLVVVGLRLLGALEQRDLARACREDLLGGVAGDAEQACDGALAVTGGVQGEDGGASFFIQHEGPPW